MPRLQSRGRRAAAAGSGSRRSRAPRARGRVRSRPSGRRAINASPSRRDLGHAAVAAAGLGRHQRPVEQVVQRLHRVPGALVAEAHRLGRGGDRALAAIASSRAMRSTPTCRARRAGARDRPLPPHPSPCRLRTGEENDDQVGEATSKGQRRFGKPVFFESVRLPAQSAGPVRPVWRRRRGGNRPSPNLSPQAGRGMKGERRKLSPAPRPPTSSARAGRCAGRGW